MTPINLFVFIYIEIYIYHVLYKCILYYRINSLKQAMEKKENEELTYKPQVSKHSVKLLKHRNEINEGLTVSTVKYTRL